MKTYIYMVRHGDSPKIGEERTRGLTEKGETDADRLAALLKDESIDAIISSPYKRSILTVQPLATAIGQEVLIFEDLKERIFSSEGTRMPDQELFPLLEKSFSDPNYSLPGAESNIEAQNRAIKLFKNILNTYCGSKVVLCTHGAVLTLVMGYYDSKYDLEFLLKTSKPDIYLMEFNFEELVEIQRVWNQAHN